MDKQQAINETRNMLQAGNLTEDILDFWTENYGLSYVEALQTVNHALDSLQTFTPQYWAVQ